MICSECKKYFEPTAHLVAALKNEKAGNCFCSRLCKNKFHNAVNGSRKLKPKTEVNCSFCNELFLANGRQIANLANGKGAYCSDKCVSYSLKLRNKEKKMITKINENAIQQDEEDKLLLRGAQIRRERAKTGMSQITMSKKLGINVKVLDAIELGSKSMLSCDVVLKCIKEKIFPIPDSENGIKCGVCESCNASYIRPTNDLKKCKSCIEKEKRPAQKAEVKPVQNDNTIKGTFNDFSNIINALFRLLPNSEQQKVIDKLIDAVDASPSKR